MTKKQLGIIMTLMALIVCVGVLSTKLNAENLSDPTTGLATMLEQKDLEEETEETLSTQEYFDELRIEKETTYQTYIDEMTEMAENESASQEEKDIANNSLIQKTELNEKEGKVELMVEQQGYEDVVCMINDENVVVYVAVEEGLTSTETALIQQTVIEVTGIDGVKIESRK